MTNKPRELTVEERDFINKGKPVNHTTIIYSIPKDKLIVLLDSRSAYELALKQVDILAQGMETAKETVHRVVKERDELLARLEKHAEYATAISKELDNARTQLISLKTGYLHAPMSAAVQLTCEHKFRCVACGKLYGEKP